MKYDDMVSSFLLSKPRLVSSAEIRSHRASRLATILITAFHVFPPSCEY